MAAWGIRQPPGCFFASNRAPAPSLDQFILLALGSQQAATNFS
jgi:hypothetical protein